MAVVTSGTARPGAGWDASRPLLCAALLVASCTTQIDNAAEVTPPVGVTTGALCPVGGTTSVSGTVVAPTPARFGRADPLYNAMVYVPTAPVAAFAPGVACERCGPLSGAPRTVVRTGPDGRFTLTGVPAGRNVPLVVQIGRWRRQVTVPEVTACADTPLPTELTRLPRSRAEGDIPAIAIATGEWDPFDCTLRKIGIDESEFTLPGGAGRVNMWMYGGHHLGPGTPYGDLLVSDPSLLSRYDIVLLPCDSASPKDPALQRNLVDYANRGGRIFLTDWSYAWLRDGVRGAFESTVVWKSAGSRLLRTADFVGRVDQEFPQGMSFSEWLGLVGATGATSGQIPIHDAFGSPSIVESVVPPTQAWIYTDASTGGAPSIENFTFNTPVGIAAGQQCGRVVFSQFHVASDSIEDDLLGNGSTPVGRLAAPTFPAACAAGPMTPQEKALEFMLFDASSCIAGERGPRVIP